MGLENTLQNDIKFIPQTSDQTILASYYSMADVFVICSKKENFPTTCIEAQCCGTPVVGFDTGGTKETSVLGENDFVEYGDIDGLSEKCSKYLNSSPDNLALKASMSYSKDNMAKQYLDEYDKKGRKNRILLIDVNCMHSSTGKIVYDLYEKIKADGREASICYGRGDKVEGKNIYKFGLDIETVLHAGLARITGYNGMFSPLSTYRLIRYIDRFKPDLIHIHELHAYFVNIKPLIKYIKNKGIPVVWTFHCEYMYTGKCGHAHDCNGYMEKCGNCPMIHEYPKSILFDKTAQMLSMKKKLLSNLDFTIVTPSAWLANRVSKSFLSKKKVVVIHNGIDTKLFSPKSTDDLRHELDIPINNKVVLSVAPDIMSDRKGGKWVVKLAEKMNTENITFILVGVK